MTGYIFLVLTLLFYISLTLFKPAVGQNDVIGGFLMAAFYGIGIISSLILTISVARHGGFDWVSDQSGTRNVVVGVGWLCMTLATLACAAFKWEWHPGEFPEFLHWFSKNNGQILIALLMLVPYFYLLSTESRASVLPNIKIPLIIGFALSAFVVLILLFSWFKIKANQQKADIEWHKERDNRAQDGPLGFIEKQKTTDPIENILSFTGHYQNEKIRLAAIAKIKERLDWENDIIELLNKNHNYNYDVYTFLEAHKVEHPEKFLEPINRCILRLADEVRAYIEQSEILNEWSFEGYDIKRLLKIVDEQFVNKGFNFRPAILKLQAALATERRLSSDKNLQFDEQKVVNDWLKKH